MTTPRAADRDRLPHPVVNAIDVDAEEIDFASEAVSLEQIVHGLGRNPGADRFGARESPAGVLDFALIAFDQETGPAEFTREHRRVAAGRATSELDERLGCRSDLLEERPQHAVFLILREQAESTGGQTLGIRQARWIDIRGADQAIDARLQMPELTKHVFVLLGERVEILLDPVNAPADRQLRLGLHPLSKTSPQTLNHAD